MNNTLYEILCSREDMSKYLFHFTKGKNAKDTLVSIIKEGKVRDVNQTGRICFSEAPVTMLAPMFEVFRHYPYPLYAPYGVGIRKDVIYQEGGRPVFYGDKTDEKILPKALKWRYELYNPEKHDFTWLREWRLPKVEVELSFDNCFFIVDTNSEIEELWPLFNTLDVDIDAQPEDGGALVNYTVNILKRYRMVSMEDISKVCMMNKKELRKELSKQLEEDCLHGSSWE